MKRVATLLLAAGLLCTVASRATAAPTSSDPKIAARDADAWLAGKVNAAGFIPTASDPTKPDYSSSSQAVVALAAAGVGKDQVDALVGYLGHHVDDAVARAGADDPGALANLILAARAAGSDATAFGTPATNLVTRLVATQQVNGLFGSSDPTFDGAFREGLSLLALHAAGVTNAAGVTWLEGQQCADGSWTAYRADTKLACPPVDPNTFSGPDTNSTALAALGLAAQGARTPARNGVAALEAVRNAQGGWGFLARSDQATDADSTAVVLEALRTVNSAVDGRGVRALLALQLGCDAAVADRGALAFQPGEGGALTPNLLATVQAVPGLAGVAMPVVAPPIASGVPVPCAATVTTTTVGTVTTLGATVPSSTVVPAATLPRTGSASGALAGLGVVIAATGLTLIGGARRRRRAP